MSAALLRARGLTRTFRTSSRPARTVTALADVDLDVAPGDTLGIVGRSGSGKSTLLRLLLALDAPTSGRVLLDERPVVPGPARRLRSFRRAVQYVPQDCAGSLDPRASVGRQLVEPLRRLGVDGDHEALVARALDRVHLGASHAERRPSELSGGQAQRVAIARALAIGPRLLLADEAVSGLDLPLRNDVLDLLDELATAHGLGIVLVSHDLEAVERLCTRAVVLSAGRLVEQGPTGRLLRHPSHDATRELVGALPRLPPPGGGQR